MPKTNYYDQRGLAIFYDFDKRAVDTSALFIYHGPSFLAYRVSHPVIQFYIDFAFASRCSCCRACSMGPCRFFEGRPVHIHVRRAGSIPHHWGSDRLRQVYGVLSTLLVHVLPSFCRNLPSAPSILIFWCKVAALRRSHCP